MKLIKRNQRVVDNELAVLLVGTAIKLKLMGGGQ
jgi:hypothetical protein